MTTTAFDEHIATPVVEVSYNDPNADGWPDIPQGWYYLLRYEGFGAVETGHRGPYVSDEMAYQAGCFAWHSGDCDPAPLEIN